MAEILVVAEHRNNELREITLQMLNKASDLCQKNGYNLSVALLGNNTDKFINDLRDRADRVIVFNDQRIPGSPRW
jgi:electron transfer flavoprotein alpha subunit